MAKLGKFDREKTERMQKEVDVYRTTDKTNRFDENGHEVLNPTVMAPPLGYKKQLSIAEQVRQQIRSMKALQDDEPETEEEADDFDIADDPVMPSRWENDMVPSIKETRKRAKQLEAEIRLYARPREEKNTVDDTGRGSRENAPVRDVRRDGGVDKEK